MSCLRDLNEYILEEYNKIENCEELSSPLLISSDKSYTESLERRIMYIGQETNCWFNYDNPSSEVTVQALEQSYFEFLKCGARNRDFWKYFKQMLEITDDKLINNVIWNNTFVAGRRREIGHPPVTKKLSDLSIEYLLNVRKIFEPEHIILVSGPTNPYYELTIKFLKEVKSSLVETYPTMVNPLVIDEKNNIFWTYHPGFQNRKHINNEIMEKIKKKII